MEKIEISIPEKTVYAARKRTRFGDIMIELAKQINKSESTTK